MFGKKWEERTRPLETIQIQFEPLKWIAAPTAAVSSPEEANVKGTLTERPRFDYQAYTGKTEKLCPESLQNEKPEAYTGKTEKLCPESLQGNH
jgi:hypothetical protein